VFGVVPSRWVEFVFELLVPVAPGAPEFVFELLCPEVGLVDWATATPPSMSAPIAPAMVMVRMCSSLLRMTGLQTRGGTQLFRLWSFDIATNRHGPPALFGRRTQMVLDEPASWDDAEEAIADVIDRICEAMSPDLGPAPDPAEIQALVDAFLDARPAGSTLGLEHRLLSLCRALEELGPAARARDVVACACEHADRWN
jgi:hypothetical protein